MATLRKQLQDELRTRIAAHADLPVREIAEVPEVKELLEALYPTRVAARWIDAAEIEAQWQRIERNQQQRGWYDERKAKEDAA